MPQEEEVDNRGENGPIQPTDGDRDRLFAQFSEATDLDQIVSLFRELCQETQVDPDGYESVYPSLKAGLTAWKPLSIWELLDARAELGVYETQNACRGRRVLVVGAGPVGLRMAIEVALLGARVDLVEKRSGFSRNNSLHLWPFLITDLRNLGAKKFYGRFATGSLDHICIRILQSILVKVCLILGVRVHVGVTFSSLVEPTASTGWRVSTQPPSCPVNTLEFDAVLAADGKKNSLPGFKLKEFRAKLALAITANFVNGNTQHENSVPEISGVSYVYRMDFFNSLSEKYGIELENIVYYKSETHYFVMTAKKPSLLKKGVLKKDYNDPKQLLSPSNIDTTALKKYTVEAADFSTEGALPLTFLKNDRGEDDVALFDFTSLFASENAARIVERKGRRILLCVAGDSLNEPFWPTGSGCGRGFLGAFDAAWMLKRYCGGISPLELVEEREALFYLLPQTTPERLGKNLTGYTIDPKTRYPNLSELVPPGDVSHLYDTDNPSAKPPPQVHKPARQLAPVPAKEATPPPSLVKAATVSEGLGPFCGKRSRSSEDLIAISEMTLAKNTASSSTKSEKEHASQVASPAEKNAASTQEKIKMFKAREASQCSQKPPLKTEKQKKTPPMEETPVSSKQSSAKETATNTPESPKSKQKGFRRLLRSKSKSPSPTLSSEDEAKEESTKQVKAKRVAGSPKKQEDAHPRPSGHPLGVAKQAKTGHPESPSTEAKQKTKNEAKRAEEENQPETAAASVADIVKRLDPHRPTTKQPSEEKKKKEKGKKERKPKEKEKKKSNEESKEKKDDGKSGGRLSFFKSKKSYDVSKATSQPSKKSSASPELKKKKKLNSEKQAVQQVAVHSLHLQQRIERLKELGVGRAETDGPGLVLSLEELRDLELSHGLIPVERGDGEGGEEARGGRSKSPAGQSEDGLESEESNRSRSSTPVCSSAGEEKRPRSRASNASTGAATYGTSSRGVSPIQGDWRVGATSGEEDGSEKDPAGEEMVVEEGEFTMERTPSVVETIRQLEPLSAAYSVSGIAT
ncbi:[F-actin]-monooxygenase mical1 [Geodia barretti]|uniref:[F-actin]-monooxygenase mical1 n=1 Tax=Geodia barretti TaxID=519541 RepID=A0AA35TWU9_GEOBA|nr:[F-actin]-monooxygenase mical1 [Geodia barretti]